ncbi:MAG TPA: fibrillarin-like rRNA/tRNA 2'-O-methyltransferase [Thermoplasmata archaeon]|nr:fibrillarin-like rRNA/tRNA 2'-O-methyltransferase [Thermoplasmata archaeon]
MVRAERTELWTEAVGDPPPVYGERWTEISDRRSRLFEASRSKLAAAVLRGWTGDLPAPGERWLYLGAASGTTASHIADMLGPEGRLYAVERSLRPFARLLALAERWPNLRPILADARDPTSYAALVPPADGMYVDIAQADQIDIVLRNAELLLRGEGARILVALKTASMGRHRSAVGHRDSAEGGLADSTALVPSVSLEPFHRGHFMVGGRWGRSSRLPARAPGRPASPRGRRPGRRAR